MTSGSSSLTAARSASAPSHTARSERALRPPSTRAWLPTGCRSVPPPAHRPTSTALPAYLTSAANVSHRQRPRTAIPNGSARSGTTDDRKAAADRHPELTAVSEVHLSLATLRMLLLEERLSVRPGQRSPVTCVKDMRDWGVTPHVAQRAHSAIDGRTTRHSGYGVSQKIRKQIEEIFGWMETVGGFRRTPYRGVERIGLAGYFVARWSSRLWRRPGCRHRAARLTGTSDRRSDGLQDP